MKKVGKIILKFVEFLIILYVVIISTVLLCRNKYGYTQFGDKTIVTMGQKDTKYLEEFDKKDLIVLKSVEFDETKVGEEVYYYAIENENYIIKKGKISDKSGEASNAIYSIEQSDTKDVSNDKVLGKLDKVYSNLGQILFFLSSRIGFLIFVLLPILVLFIYEIYDFIMEIKYEKVKPTKSNSDKNKKDTKNNKSTKKDIKNNKDKKNEEIETL